jgi:hypothetical protein
MTITFNLRIIEYEFWGERFRFSGRQCFCSPSLSASSAAPTGSQKFIKLMLGIMIISLAIRYIALYFIS